MQNYKKKFNMNAVEVKFFLGYTVTRLHGEKGLGYRLQWSVGRGQ